MNSNDPDLPPFRELLANYRILKTLPEPPCPEGYRVVPLGYLSKQTVNPLRWNAFYQPLATNTYVAFLKTWFYKSEYMMLKKSIIHPPHDGCKIFTIIYVEDRRYTITTDYDTM